MNTSDLDYHLPDHLIAQQPAEPRDSARLLIVNRAAQVIAEDTFINLSKHLHAGDCLVLNDTRVVRARLHAMKESGGRVEIFCLRDESPGIWRALVRPSARVKPGTRVQLAAGLSAVVGDVLDEGQRRIHFDSPDVLGILERAGEIPLPPYIHREEAAASDLTRYQTVFAQQPGAVAAPTAGLHFTDRVFAALADRGVQSAKVTLHVGYGTFKPITADTLEDHRVDPEDFKMGEDTASTLNATRARGGRVIAVGTTATRVLETVYREGAYSAAQGETNAYLYPPYQFRAIDALLTNFHLPKSSLLALVFAFAGRELTLAAYDYAIKNEFRFYSYGDAMLIL